MKNKHSHILLRKISSAPETGTHVHLENLLLHIKFYSQEILIPESQFYQNQPKKEGAEKKKMKTHHIRIRLHGLLKELVLGGIKRKRKILQNKI